MRRAGELIARTVAPHLTAQRLFDQFFDAWRAPARRRRGARARRAVELARAARGHPAAGARSAESLVRGGARASAMSPLVPLQESPRHPGKTAENMNTAVANFEQSVQRELARVIVGAEDVDPRAVHRADRARPRAGAGPARSRQDAAGQDAGARARRRVQARAGHGGPHAERHRRHARVRRVEERVRVPPRAAVRRRAAGGRDQPHRARRRSPRCSRRWRSGRSASERDHVSRCPRISWCWPRRIRASSKAPIHCRSRSSTASCCAST